jgi:hypothetical protein
LSGHVEALKIMKDWPPSSITTDKLASYPRAIRRLKREGKLADAVRHRTSKDLNNIHRGRSWRAETHDPKGARLQDHVDIFCHNQGIRDHAHDPL